MSDPLRLSDAECFALLHALFPLGFADPALLAELAPDGWPACPLYLALHPAPDQQTAETDHPVWNDPARPADATPPSDPEELADLVGRAAWDIFSDNHSVLAPTAARPTWVPFAPPAPSSTRSTTTFPDARPPISRITTAPFTAAP
ncbi:MAG: hypothetical protein NTU80_06305 [Verrucomicrobia bacterium]|nr:hypothetical protein [Verrucomicrobiota bacterium]